MFRAALRRVNVRLVDDWHRSWRWSSMRILAVAGAAEIALAKCPESVCSHVPEWIMSTLSTFVLLAPMIAMGARITTTDPKDGDSNVRPS